MKLNLDNNMVKDDLPTLDRIIPELGYIKGNVKVISWLANTIKSCGNAEQHDLVVKYIRENTVTP